MGCCEDTKEKKVKAILTMGDFISQQEVPDHGGCPQPEFRFAIYGRLQPLIVPTESEVYNWSSRELQIKYLVFDLRGVISGTAFYEFNRIVNG